MKQWQYIVRACVTLAFACVAVLFLGMFVTGEPFASERVNASQGFCGTVTPVTPPEFLPGKNLFSANCATCHALDKVLTGPALRGVENRGPWVSRKRLIEWVRNPAAMIPRFAYTRGLAQEFGGQVMPSFPQLAPEQIEAIFDYIKDAPSFSPVPVAMN